MAGRGDENEDIELMSRMLRIENKLIFIDLRRNSTGLYLKISEKRAGLKNSVLIPANGITALKQALDEVSAAADEAVARFTPSIMNEHPRMPESHYQQPPPIPIAMHPQSSATTSSVIVSNLASSSTEASVAQFFRPVGPVVNVQIYTRVNRGVIVPSGRATVNFSFPAAAARAVQMMNGAELDGRSIIVQPGIPDAQTSPAYYDATTIPAPMSMPQAAPTSHTSTTHYSNTYPSGGGRGSYQSSNRRPLPMQASSSLMPPPPPGTVPEKFIGMEPVACKVFVQSLPWETSDKELYDFFKGMEGIRSAFIRRSRSGRSSGQGVVDFATHAQAMQAIEQLNQRELDGRTITVRPYFDFEGA